MKKTALWFVTAALLGSGALTYALASGEKREDCPGKIICPLTGQEICKDQCPLGSKAVTPYCSSGEVARPRSRLRVPASTPSARTRTCS